MNILLLQPDDFIDPQRAVVNDHRAEHIRRVLRAKPGDPLRVGLLGGGRGEALISSLNPTSITLFIPQPLDEPPPARHPWRLVLALPRPKMLRRVLRCCAELGVANVHLIHSYRVEKSYWQSPLLSPEALERALFAGLERAGDTVTPQVTLHPRFRPFIEDELPALAEGNPIYLAHPGSTRRPPTDSGEQATLVIGPEGGFIPFEVELAESLGAITCTLGTRTLSVDTAVNAALARQLYSTST